MKDGTKQEIIATTARVLRNHGVRRAALFGSLVRGEATPHSDIDLLVEMSDGQSLLDLVDVKLDLEESLQRKVDVLTYDSISPLLRDQILREQEPIYEA